VPAGLPGAGPVRLLDLEKGLFIAVADLPLDKYNESAISSGLANLDWSRASRSRTKPCRVVRRREGRAADEAVPDFKSEASGRSSTCDRNARASRPWSSVSRISRSGYPVVLDRTRAARRRKAARRRAYRRVVLAQKKAQRDGAKELASGPATRRRGGRIGCGAPPATRSGGRRASCRAQGGRSARRGILVPRARAARSRRGGRESKALSRHGYGLTLSGPWPRIPRPGLMMARASKPVTIPWPIGCSTAESTLLDLLDNLLNKGVMANGDVTLRRRGDRFDLPALSALLWRLGSLLPNT